MSATYPCPYCLTPIPPSVPAGIGCPGCLLLHALEPSQNHEGVFGGESPRYELLSEIGRGGMGVVFKARHVAADRVVAVKVLRGADLTDDGRRRRFRVETQALGRLRHPNIVQIFDVGDEGGCPYFSMEYLEGGTLADRIARSGPISPDEAAAIATLLARALDAAHRAGVLHRDLKPANVLLSVAGVPKVTDFSLAKRLDAPDGETSSGMALGTPSYMAPEQATHPKLVGVRTDVYGLGATLYAMLTGRPPHRAETPLATLFLTVGTPVVPPSQFGPTPAGLEAICLKCLAKRPEDRYPTAAAAAEALERWQNGTPTSRPQRSTRLGRGMRIGLTLVLAAALPWTAVTTGESSTRPTTHETSVAVASRGTPQGPQTAGRWVAGEALLTLTDDGAVTFQTMRNSLLEFAAPADTRFRVRAELRHHSARTGGAIGLYLSYTAQRTVDGGRCHQAVCITFTDTGTIRGNQMPLRRLAGSTYVLFDKPAGRDTERSRSLKGVFEFPAWGEDAGPWRTLQADVGPDELGIHWKADDGSQVETFAWTADEINQSARQHTPHLASGIAPLVWVPNRPLGIFARDSHISVRNVTVEPVFAPNSP